MKILFIFTCLAFFFSPLFVSFHQIGDRNGELTARMNVEQLMEVLGVSESDLSPSSSEFEMQGESNINAKFSNSNFRFNRNVSIICNTGTITVFFAGHNHLISACIYCAEGM